jgi:hypothetical protein
MKQDQTESTQSNKPVARPRKKSMQKMRKEEREGGAKIRSAMKLSA